MAGLLYPAYQKFYSALCNLKRFEKEQNFFDNISSLDNFFSEFRSITLVLQKSLSHTPYIDYYNELVKGYFDPWLNAQRVKAVHTHPVEIIKQLDISIYFPNGSMDIYSDNFTVENDIALSSINDDLKTLFCKLSKTEIFFSAKFAFIENDSKEDLWDKILVGIVRMQKFMENIYSKVGEICNLCEELRRKILKVNVANMPKDFLLASDYVYYPQKDEFVRATRISLGIFADEIMKQRHSLKEFMENSRTNFDGTPFGNFVLMHVYIRTRQPDVMPTIMIVYDDDTYTLDSFNGSIKTTIYRKINEVADRIKRENIKEIFWVNTYLYCDYNKKSSHLTSAERAQNFKSEYLTFMAVDCKLKETEYIFDTKYIHDPRYVSLLLRTGKQDKLNFGINNMQPIIRAFKTKLQNN